MNSSDTRIAGYLDTLTRLTADLDPATRDDVIAGVREHLDAALAERPDDPAAVDAALLRLGPPEQVAAAARADFAPSAPQGTPPSHPGHAVQRADTPRQPLWARVAGLAAMTMLALPTAVALVSRVGAELSADGGALGLHPSEALVLLVPMFPLWVVAVVVALLGRDLAGRTRVWLVLLGPAMSAAVLLSALLSDPRSFATPLVLVALGGVLVGVVLTGRRVVRETRA